MRLQNFGKSLLIASIPGVVMPIAFFLLFSFNTTATRRDVLPSLNDPFEAVGCYGFIIFSIPILLTIICLIVLGNTMHDHGYVIPFFDSLTSKQQFDVIITVGFICNLVLWTVLISYWRQHKNEVAMQSGLVFNDNQEAIDKAR